MRRGAAAAIHKGRWVPVRLPLPSLQPRAAAYRFCPICPFASSLTSGGNPVISPALILDLTSSIAFVAVGSEESNRRGALRWKRKREGWGGGCPLAASRAPCGRGAGHACMRGCANANAKHVVATWLAPRGRVAFQVLFSLFARGRVLVGWAPPHTVVGFPILAGKGGKRILNFK